MKMSISEGQKLHCCTMTLGSGRRSFCLSYWTHPTGSLWPKLPSAKPLPSSFFRAASPLATCAKLQTRLPPNSQSFPKPRPPPLDSTTCPHPSPRFCSNPGLHARLSQARGVDVPRPPRSMLRGRLGDTAPAEEPRAPPLGAGQMQEAFVASAGAFGAAALLRGRGYKRSGFGPR